VALQGIEFWSNVCDEEMDLAIEASEVSLGWASLRRAAIVSGLDTSSPGGVLFWLGDCRDCFSAYQIPLLIRQCMFLPVSGIYTGSSVVNTRGQQIVSLLKWPQGIVSLGPRCVIDNLPALEK
jgi:hypothetical protein